MLNLAQQEVVDRGLLESPFSCVLQMATGSGKTWLAAQAAKQVIAAGHRAVYLTPLRALADEIAEGWKRHMPGVQIGVFTGDYGREGKPFPVPFRDARLLVMTPERLDACTRAWRAHWPWLPEVDLVIADELHLLGDGRRGGRLEGVINRFRRLNPFARIIGLSATLGNTAELADWLDATFHTSSWRPIPLSWRVARFSKAADKPELLYKQLISGEESNAQSLVFVQSRRRAEELARFLQSKGVSAGHHHAGLRRDQRLNAERAFRAGQIKVVVATATLEMGLNLPVRQVILYDLQKFDGSSFVPLPVNSVWQRAGRAGRPGLDDQGEVVLFLPSWDRNAPHYEAGHFESIGSRLSDPSVLAEQIIAEVASGLCRESIHVKNSLSRSLAAAQDRLPDVDHTIRDMCDAKMLVEIEEETSEQKTRLRLKATRIGRIAARHMLLPKTVLIMRRILEQHPSLTLFDALLMVSVSGDAEPILTVDFEELEDLSSALLEERSVLLRLTPEECKQLFGDDDRRLLSAIKMALVLRHWTRIGDTAIVGDQMDCYAFEVERLVESATRILQAACAMLPPEEEEARNPFEHASLAERLGGLRRMVTYGLNERTATLALIPGIGGKFAKRLAALGIEDLEDLANADVETVASVRGVSAIRAEKWIDMALEMVGQYSAYTLDDDAPRALTAKSDWPQDLDPYRLRRSLELTVDQDGYHRYMVTGGLEPHLVTVRKDALVCDCADAARGNRCKHVLAVGLKRRDRDLMSWVKCLGDGGQTDSEGINLFGLWMSSAPQRLRRRTA